MFEKATKAKAKARIAIFGPSGSGKTFSALRIATGLGGKIAVIDSERRSARKYSDRFSFDVCELNDRTIDGYCKAIDEAGDYGVLIIDSGSHAWQELLAEVESLAKAKYRGNTWSAWSEGTPKQHQFIDKILSFPGHIVMSMRSDTAWESEKDERTGKTRPVKIGLKPQQGKGIEYEFDLLIELSPEHVANITKDRTGKFQDKTIEKPGEDFGKELAAWLSDGAEPAKDDTPPDLKNQKRPELVEIAKVISEYKINDVQIAAWCQHFKVTALHQLTTEQVNKIINKVKKEAAKSAA